MGHRPQRRVDDLSAFEREPKDITREIICDIGTDAAGATSARLGHTLRRVRQRSRLGALVGTALAVMALACSCGSESNRSTSTAARPLNTPEAPTTGPPTTAVAEGLDLDLEWAPVLDGLGVPDLSSVAMGQRFTTSFEDPTELASWYVTPQSALTHHETSSEQVHSGDSAHKAWVTGAGGPGLEVDGPNHRGYPTVQLDVLGASSGLRSPTLTELWVWLDVSLETGQWFSFATFTNDPSDRWARVVTVNLDPGGWVNAFHVPRRNEGQPELQRTDVTLPMRTWVRLSVYLDFDPERGAIAVWQDGVLVAASSVDPGDTSANALMQAHFGLYAPPEVSEALVYNDDLSIAELKVSDASASGAQP